MNKFRCARLSGKSKTNYLSEIMIRIINDLQRQVSNEFRISEATGFAAMRLADKIFNDRGDFPSLKEANEISLYRKYNRCHDGNLNEGDIAPNVPQLIRANDNAAKSLFGVKIEALHSHINGNRPLVMFAGSYS